MSTTRLEWKVGLFVLVSLVLLGTLIVKFSKGTAWFVPTYQVTMRTKDVGGIIPGALVLMAGVKVGHVTATELEPGGRSVKIELAIEKRYSIHQDAVFTIQQAGFLGDRHVSIVSGENRLPPLQPGEEVEGQEAFDLQQMAHSAAGFLQNLDETARRISEIVDRIDRILFVEKTLTNLTATVSNFRQISDRALATMNGVEQFVKTNTHPLSASVSNLVFFSEELSQTAAEVRETVATNRAEVASLIKNFESASLQIDHLLTDLQKGEGVLGRILKDKGLEEDFLATVNNLSLLSSNLNKFGILWKPKVRGPSLELPAAYTGRSPFD